MDGVWALLLSLVLKDSEQFSDLWPKSRDFMGQKCRRERRCPVWALLLPKDSEQSSDLWPRLWKGCGRKSDHFAQNTGTNRICELSSQLCVKYSRGQGFEDKVLEASLNEYSTDRIKRGKGKWEGDRERQSLRTLHRMIIMPLAMESGSDKLEFRVVAEQSSGETLLWEQIEPDRMYGATSPSGKK
ncbi:hypothetical protein C8J57DRAFT_1257587 [Mycena rebaudengoi]|nr:hypothetical protein C8J57DRAFT_1257587 [Mycena rebaudengoi]